jgi:hypothetical protein
VIFPSLRKHPVKKGKKKAWTHCYWPGGGYLERRCISGGFEITQASEKTLDR